MDFKDSIMLLSDKVVKMKDNIKTEEATKTSFVLPFIQSLGYDIFNIDMKKILLLAIMAATASLYGCNKDEERTAQTIFVHIADYDGHIVTINPNNTAVFFFKDNGKEIDYTASSPLFNDHKLTYTDGTYSDEAAIYDSGKPGVYTFENVPNGQYILWVHYYPYSSGWQSSKKIVVNDDSHLMVETKIFKGGGRYEEW